MILGRGASHTGRSTIVRTCGQYGSENAGMSSENYVRIIMAENQRIPGEGSSAQGKSGAKARPGGVVDAQTVEIPLPPKDLSTLTHEDIRTPAMVDRGERDRKIVGKPEKPCGEKRCEVYLRCPYRKPTQVDEERILRPTGEGLSRNSAS